MIKLKDLIKEGTSSENKSIANTCANALPYFMKSYANMVAFDKWKHFINSKYAKELTNLEVRHIHDTIYGMIGKYNTNKLKQEARDLILQMLNNK